MQRLLDFAIIHHHASHETHMLTAHAMSYECRHRQDCGEDAGQEAITSIDLRTQHPSGSSKLRIPRFGYEVAAYSLLHPNENEHAQDDYSLWTPMTASVY